MQILDEIIDAQGGMDLWNIIDELDVVLSSQGFLFTSLMRWRAAVVKRKQVRLLTREPRLTFFDLAESGLRSELIGNDEVRIIDGNGTTVAQRMNPRATFRPDCQIRTKDVLSGLHHEYWLQRIGATSGWTFCGAQGQLEMWAVAPANVPPIPPSDPIGEAIVEAVKLVSRQGGEPFRNTAPHRVGVVSVN
jgi:hypothetical protein